MSLESIQYYNNITNTDLTRSLITIDAELESEDVKSIKFLCQDDIPFKTLERINDGLQVFNELDRLGKIDTNQRNVDFLLECLCRCHRMDLIKKLGFNQAQVKNRVESAHSNFSPYRVMLFEIAEEMETTDMKTALFTLSSYIPRSKHNKIESMFDVFTHLERSGELSVDKVSVLEKLLKMLDRADLLDKIRKYQGFEGTGMNTEPGYGPVDEGDVPTSRGTAGMEPVLNFYDQSMAVERNEYQNSTANNVNVQNQGLIVDIKDINRNKNGPQKVTISEQVLERMKREDRENDRVVPGRETGGLPTSLTTEQEHPSLQDLPSIRVVNRVGYSNEIPRNHLMERNDRIEEEQSPGDSGLTAGTVSLSDESSREISGLHGLTSEESDQYLTERKMICVSEVIAKHDNWVLLSEKLNIDTDTLRGILLTNPTREAQIHALLKRWIFDPNKDNTSRPNAVVLSEALRSLNFTDAIQELFRLDSESEMETEEYSENVAVRSERTSLNLEQNNYVSSGEARPEIQQMDLQGPANPVPMSNSDAQVGPSLNPSLNFNPPSRREEEMVRQMETVVIDDAIMPFYKMDARPRGIAIIISNKNFFKIPNDPQSKEMPSRTGTEKDAEKLEYLWTKLGFEVKSYTDLDSTKMCQIMVETAMNIDHARYDCLVCCILTHGVLGHVYGTDGRIVRINQLTSCFSGRRCPTLAGKPKMFFIQACQGRDKQEGHQIETDAGVVGVDTPQEDPSHDLRVDRPRELIPDEADFLLGYATVPGYVSYRSRSQGSWYINKLAQNLDKYAYQHDLLSILIKVNEEVGRATANIDNGAYKQIPAPMFTLRKRIIFR